MRSLRTRARAEEQMDDPALDPQIYEAVLKGLERVNRWTFASRPTFSFLERVVRERGRFRLLDVGFGDGDMLRLIGRWAARSGLALELVGVDLNPKSAAVAAAATPPELGIDYRTGDYRDLGPFDFVISSLVAHHMTDRELREFVAWMEANARHGWLINDLHRHLFSYHGFPLLARLLRVHRIVREDGQLSIARSFRPREWREILAGAGIPGSAANIVRYFPFRLCVERPR